MNSTFAILSTLVVGLLGVLLAIPLLLNKIPRNGLYGFRTPLTLSSDEVWYPANRFAAKGLILWGLLNLIAALLAWASQPLTPQMQDLLILPPLTIILVVLVSLIWLKKNFGAHW